jgi:hypothetical protein
VWICMDELGLERYVGAFGDKYSDPVKYC